MDDSTVVVLGSISLTDNPLSPLNYVAQCDLDLNSCDPMGNGLQAVNFSSGELLQSPTGDIYAVYTTGTHLGINWYFQSVWQSILLVEYNSGYPFSAVIYDGSLVIFGNFTITDGLCDGGSLQNAAQFFVSSPDEIVNCWTNASYFSTISLDSRIVSGSGQLFSFDPFGALQYNGSQWLNITNDLFSLCPNGLQNESFDSSLRDSLLVTCDNAIVGFNLISEEWGLVWKPNCSETQVDWPFVRFLVHEDKVIYSACVTSDNSFRLLTYDLATGEAGNTTEIDLYNPANQIGAMCGFGSNVFVGGQFVKAGDATISNQGAVWNGNAWLPVLPDYQLSDVACTSLDTTLYLVHSDLVSLRLSRFTAGSDSVYEYPPIFAGSKIDLFH